MKLYLEGLNGKQREGVRSSAKKTLILAGAGSGKTRVLTRRIVKHIVEDAISPSEILAVTFTNKAAKEMKERLANLFEENGVADRGKVFAGTFHSFCARVLRKHYSYANIDRNYVLLDPDGQKRIFRDLIALDRKSALERCEDQESQHVVMAKFALINAALPSVIKVIDYLKNLGVPPAKSTAHFIKVFPSEPELGAKLYRKYELYKNHYSMLDFNDLIIKTILAMTKHPELQRGLQDSFKAILVDEFQDTNNLQFKLISMITTNETFVTTVGDDDQLIYEWRGAEIRNILEYPDKQGVAVIKLEENYRSTNKILTAANAVIKPNELRLGKSLWTSASDGVDINVVSTSSYKSEVSWVVSHVSELVRMGVTPSDIAILYRSNSLSGPIEVGMHKSNLKYDLVGGLNFWMRKEVQAVLSFARWAFNQNDVASIQLALTCQKCGYGEKTHIALLEQSRIDGVSLEDTILGYCEGATSDNKKKLANTVTLVRMFRQMNPEKVGELLEVICKKTEVVRYIESKEKDKSKLLDKIENINTLIGMAYDFSFVDDYHQDYVPDSRLEAFLQSSDLQVEDVKGDSSERVVMMTIHASKGLEFKHVVVVGMEEGIFPSFASIEKGYFEEERRLAYVAITRAMESLSLCSTQFRIGRKPPLQESRFLSDIPRSVIQNINLKKEKWF